MARFVENPPQEVASSLISAGDAFWASGISLFRADVLIEQYRRIAPATHACVAEAVARASSGDGFLLLDATYFSGASNKSTERDL